MQDAELKDFKKPRVSWSIQSLDITESKIKVYEPALNVVDEVQSKDVLGTQEGQDEDISHRIIGGSVDYFQE